MSLLQDAVNECVAKKYGKLLSCTLCPILRSESDLRGGELYEKIEIGTVEKNILYDYASTLKYLFCR